MENFTSYRREADMPWRHDEQDQHYTYHVHKPTEDIPHVHILVREKATDGHGGKIVRTEVFPDVEYHQERQYCVKEGVLGSFLRKESRKHKPLSEVERVVNTIKSLSVEVATIALLLNNEAKKLGAHVDACKLEKHMKRAQRKLVEEGQEEEEEKSTASSEQQGAA